VEDLAGKRERPQRKKEGEKIKDCFADVPTLRAANAGEDSGGEEGGWRKKRGKKERARLSIGARLLPFGEKKEKRGGSREKKKKKKEWR